MGDSFHLMFLIIYAQSMPVNNSPFISNPLFCKEIVWINMSMNMQNLWAEKNIFKKFYLSPMQICTCDLWSRWSHWHHVGDTWSHYISSGRELNSLLIPTTWNLGLNTSAYLPFFSTLPTVPTPFPSRPAVFKDTEWLLLVYQRILLNRGKT